MEYPAWQIFGCLNILLDAWYLELMKESLGSPRASLSAGSPKERPDQEFCQVFHLGLDIRLSLIIEPNSKSYIGEDSQIDCSMHKGKWT